MRTLATLPLLLTTALASTSKPSSPLPLLIWHGLGDRYDADGLQSTGDLAQEVHPGTEIYYIRTDDDGSADRTNTFFGNISTQIADVCETLHSHPDFSKTLDKHGKEMLRFDALGFSQGGQFLRGLLQRCDGLSIRSLVTFGSQHNGIAEFQKCGTFDLLCKGATALVRDNAWTDYVQNKVVPAQYYRPVNDSTGLPKDEYLQHSNFLADVNNEREVKNATYKARLRTLEHFAMFVFEDDDTVVPRESGWFAEVNMTSGEVTPLRQRKLYTEDWLGLKALDERGGLVLRNTSGKHMQLDDADLRSAFKEFFGPEGKINEEEKETEAEEDAWMVDFDEEDLIREAKIVGVSVENLKCLIEQIERDSKVDGTSDDELSWTRADWADYVLQMALLKAEMQKDDDEDGGDGGECSRVPRVSQEAFVTMDPDQQARELVGLSSDALQQLLGPMRDEMEAVLVEGEDEIHEYL